MASEQTYTFERFPLSPHTKNPSSCSTLVYLLPPHCCFLPPNRPVTVATIRSTHSVSFPYFTEASISEGDMPELHFKHNFYIWGWIRVEERWRESHRRWTIWTENRKKKKIKCRWLNTGIWRQRNMNASCLGRDESRVRLCAGEETETGKYETVICSRTHFEDMRV